MRHYFIALLATVALSPLAVSSATACSVSDDYRIPTNLELVQQTPLIVRARVTDELVGDDAWDRHLVIEPTAVLKGSLPTGTISIDGSGLIPASDSRGFGILSNPYDLENAHPLSYIGGCIRYLFPRGTSALFFLEQRDGEWHAAGGAFSRWAEDVLAEDAPWLTLVEFYVRAAELDETERASFLTAERDRLLAQADDPVAALMAEDISRQIAGPNRKWNDIMRSAIEDGAEVPPGAESEVAAEAVAEAMMDGISVDDEVRCVESRDGNEMTCTATLEEEAEVMEEAEAMEEAAPDT